MTAKRPIIKGSFGGHFDELVKHFPHDGSTAPSRTRDERELKEKRDIHAMLFEQAWQMDSDEERNP